jgi:hypothetical protein
MNFILAILLSTLGTVVGFSTGQPTEQQIIDAYMTSPEIIHAKSEARASGHEIGEVKVIPIGSGCGVAGCQLQYLVLQKLIWRGTNPITTYLMCRVQVGPKGDIEHTERVVLVPYADLEESD